MSRTRHVGAGVPRSRLPDFSDCYSGRVQPTPAVLNVLRVALDRADMSHRATGFKSFEIEAAKEWVRGATASAAQQAEQGRE